MNYIRGKFTQTIFLGDNGYLVGLFKVLETNDNEMNDFIKKTCGGSISAFASALCDSGISKEDLLELKKYLEEIK